MTGWLRAQWARLVAGAALAAVAGVAGVISYEHIEVLSVRFGQSVMVSRLMPFGVDGLILVGSVALLTAKPGQERLGWLGVAPGLAASVFANVESGIAYGLLGAIWAGVPAGSFFVACFVLERWLKGQVSVAVTVTEGGHGTGPGAIPNDAPEPLPESLTSQPDQDPAGTADGGTGDSPNGAGEAPETTVPEPSASHPEPDPETVAAGGQDDTEEAPDPDEPEPPQCPHTAPNTTEEAVVTHYLHARDCLGEPVSQRQLAAAFGISRPKVADLIKPLNGHQLGAADDTETSATQ